MKVTTPLELDKPDAAEIVSPPRFEERVTVLPEIGFEYASVRVTVMVEVEAPFAVTDVGDATTVD